MEGTEMLLAAYLRVSRVGDRADTLVSPELQAEAIARWAEVRGYTIVPFEPELDQSGGKVDRPILETIIKRTERGELDGVVVARLNRLSRMNLAPALEVLDRIEGIGGKVFSVAENLDTTTPAGRRFRTDLLNQANYEREVQGEGFEVAKGDAVRRGIHISPRVPIGYRRGENRILEPDPVTAPAVRRAFEMRAEGHSWQVVADAVGEMIGRPYSGGTIRRVVGNPVYLGQARQGKFTNDDAHEPLVDRTLWEEAQLAMPRPPRGKHEVALLSGLVRCAGCSRRMTTSHTRGYRVYRCTGHGAGGKCKAPAQVADRAIEPLVTEAVLAEIENMTATASRHTRTTETAERKLAGAEAELASYLEATAALSDQQAFRRGAQARADAVSAAKVELAKARLAAPAVPAPEKVRDLWEDFSAAERNQLLRASLDVVWVRSGRGNDRVRIVAAGHGPEGLSTQGVLFKPRAAAWPRADLPGEVRPPLLEQAA
jgi:DNA invertase Pin-like site-specific DNA recombinase